MPLFLHERDAYEAQIEVLAQHRDAFPRAVLHCFTGTRHELRGYLDLDLHIGITGWICDERRGQHLAEIVAEIPLDRLMLETDAPFLLPRTIRPKPRSPRNESAHLVWVRDKVAACYGVDAAELGHVTARTAVAFFGL